ncbi:hypothetical protein B0T25DRAFT_4356 [Lasiosphaeria hispida]|uniref:Uncharacterized protein n=1 Tax=Lasiosphaeria hispida TaxID=260671 RepID=A0AAJ0HT14_9PEZI|nr:hypothetical protein B0T25DRAFT_4356 [Lasiosphaeria hispida]
MKLFGLRIVTAVIAATVAPRGLAHNTSSAALEPSSTVQTSSILYTSSAPAVSSTLESVVLSDTPTSSSSAPSSSTILASECEMEPSSTSASTSSSATTQLTFHVPTGYIDATSLQWTLTWRRCAMPTKATTVTSIVPIVPLPTEIAP